MRIGIFYKIVAIFAIISIVTFAAVSGILYFFLNEYFINENIGKLKNGVEKASDAFEQYFAWYNEFDKMEFSIALLLKRQIWTMFSTNLQYIGNATNADVWIVTEKGEIYYAYPDLPSSIKKDFMGSNGYVQLPAREQYMKLLNDKDGTLVELGDFFGFFSLEAYQYIGDTWLTYGERFYIDDDSSSDESKVYLVYMHMPASQIKRTQEKTFAYLWISIVISSLLAFILIYFMTRRLIDPIRQMNNLSKIIAAGEYTKRLKITTKDEIGELSENFNKMVDALEKNETMRTRFVSNVSHELRTPMTTIKGFVDGILDGTIPEEKHAYYLNIVKDEIDRLSGVVTDLLTLSRLDAAGQNITFEDFDVQEVIRRCIITLESLLVGKNLDLDIRFCSEFLYVHANKNAIERVIYNLLHNAIKFSYPNGVIRIITVVEDGLAGITVEDFGIGIPEDELENIWERFYTVDKSRSMDGTGTGLGLSIIKNVIEKHNQTITVESQPGIGTKFHFTLALSKQ